MAIRIKRSSNIDILNIKNIYCKVVGGTENSAKSIKWVYRKLGESVVLLWSTISEALSVFGAGYWQNDKPWSNIDAWKN